MSEINDLVLAQYGWRVLVVGVYYGGKEHIEERPLIGWGRVEHEPGSTSWLPCWWDDLGLTYGSPSEIAWPLAPGEDYDEDLAQSMLREVRDIYESRESKR